MTGKILRLNTDAATRTAERRWRASGDLDDGAVYLNALRRAGDETRASVSDPGLDDIQVLIDTIKAHPHRGTLLARLGDPLAMRLFGSEDQIELALLPAEWVGGGRIDNGWNPLGPGAYEELDVFALLAWAMANLASVENDFWDPTSRHLRYVRVYGRAPRRKSKGPSARSRSPRVHVDVPYSDDMSDMYVRRESGLAEVNKLSVEENVFFDSDGNQITVDGHMVTPEDELDTFFYAASRVPVFLARVDALLHAIAVGITDHTGGPVQKDWALASELAQRSIDSVMESQVDFAADQGIIGEPSLHMQFRDMGLVLNTFGNALEALTGLLRSQDARPRPWISNEMWISNEIDMFTTRYAPTENNFPHPAHDPDIHCARCDADAVHEAAFGRTDVMRRDLTDAERLELAERVRVRMRQGLVDPLYARQWHSDFRAPHGVGLFFDPAARAIVDRSGEEPR